MSKDRAPYILNASSNLLGFSFLILTSSRLVGMSGVRMVDKIAAVCVAVFALSTFISYMSIHSALPKRSEHFEWMASHLFLSGQIILTIGAILLSANVIR